MNTNDQGATSTAPVIINGHTRDQLHIPEAGLPFSDIHALDAEISRLRQAAFDTFMDEHTAAEKIVAPDVQKTARAAANLRYSSRMNEIDMQMNSREVYEAAVTRHLNSVDALPKV
jgi:hypothetical protein